MPHILKTTAKFSIAALTVFCLFGLFFIFGAIDRAAAATYESTFESRILDGHHPSVEYGDITWTADTSATTSLTVQVRAGTTTSPGDGSWTPYATVTNGQDLGTDYNGFRYLQYRATLGTDDLSETPVLYEVNVEKNTSALYSSRYDTQDKQSEFLDFGWGENLESDTDAVMQMRSSPDGSNWTNWCGPDDGDSSTSTCATEDFFTDPSGGEDIDEMFQDKEDDRYFQYKLILHSDDPSGSNIPEVTNVDMEYDVPTGVDREYESQFTSRVMDSGHPDVNYGDISWVSDVPANTSLNLEVRAGSTTPPDADWTIWTELNKDLDKTESLDAYDGYRYIQYRATLGTDDLSKTPVLQEVKITNNVSDIVSSPFNTQDTGGVVEGLRWEEILNGDSNIYFQLRTSPDGSNWSNWCGPDNGQEDSCDQYSFFRGNAGTDTVDEYFQDAVDDRYFQWKATLMGDKVNGEVPEIASTSVDYSMSERATRTYSSVFESRVMDAHHPAEFGDINYTPDIPADTSLWMYVRAGDAVDTSDPSWTDWEEVWDGTSLDGLGMSGHRYVQYKTRLGTDDLSKTPVLKDVAIETNVSALISSVYNTEGTQVEIEDLVWQESSPPGTETKFQIRTSPNGIDSWTPWCGPDDSDTSTTTCDKNSYFDTPGGDKDIDEMFTDRQNDRYVQYKAILISDGVDGSEIPQISETDLDYDLPTDIPREYESDFVSRVHDAGEYPVSFGEFWMDATYPPKTSVIPYGRAGSYSSVSTREAGESGTFTTSDGNWVTVDFNNSYDTPVVIGTTNTHNGQSGLVFEARNVSTTSAEMRVCESEGGGGSDCDTHSEETVGYVVLDAAALDGVNGIDAGTFQINESINSVTESISYSNSFSQTPGVFFTVQSQNGSGPIEAWSNSVDSSGFTAGICEQTSTDLCNDSHTTETVGWVAIEPGTGIFDQASQVGLGSAGDYNWISEDYSSAGFSNTPVVAMETQTDNGGQDSHYNEVRNLSSSGGEVRFCELDDGDTCDSHATEDYAWLAVASGDLTISSSGSIDWTDWVRLDDNDMVPQELDGHRFFQYRLTLGTDDLSVTPEVSTVTVEYYSGALRSSTFDSTDDETMWDFVNWDEDTPTGTDVFYQLRTSPDNNNWSSWQGPNGSNDYYTTSTATTSNPAHTDESEDRYVQYRAILTSKGMEPEGGGDKWMPTVYSTDIGYTAYVPNVATVTPNETYSVENPTITIKGEDYLDGASTSLVKDGMEIQSASTTVASDTELRTEFGDNMVGYHGADWDVLVHNPNGETGTATDAFTILNSGDYVSRVKDLEYDKDAKFKDMTWTEDVPASTSISVRVRTWEAEDESDQPAWDTCSDVTNGDDISSYPCVSDGDRYIQYRTRFRSDIATGTPRIEEVTVEYYGGNHLISSPFDITATDAEIRRVQWIEENVDGTSTVEVGVRTASTSDFLTDKSRLGERWYHIATSTASGLADSDSDCASTSTSTGDMLWECPTSSLPTDLRQEREENQWLQYKFVLNSDGTNAPTIYWDELTYEAEIPVVESVTPTSVDSMDSPINITVEGYDFQCSAGDDVDVELVNGDANIEDTSVTCASSTQINAEFDILGYGGEFDVVVTNPNTAQGVLEDGLTIKYIGSYTSHIYDLQGGAEFKEVTWNASTSPDSEVNINLRTADQADMEDANSWQDSYCPAIATSGGSLSILKENDCIRSDDRYLQYQAVFESEDMNQQPMLEDVTIDFDSVGSIISSPFDTAYASSALTGLRWEQNSIPVSGEEIKLLARTQGNSDNLIDTFPTCTTCIDRWWHIVGTTTVSGTESDGCTVSGGTVTCDIEAIAPEMRNIDSDQWMQYRAAFVVPNEDSAYPDGSYDQSEDSPRIYEVEMEYTHNERPQIQDFSGKQQNVEQDHPGDVKITASVRDDNNPLETNAAEYFMDVEVEYSLNGGSDWSQASSTHLDMVASSTQGEVSDDDGDGEDEIENHEDEFTDYNIYWKAKEQLPNVYSSTTRVRLIVDDGEPVLNTATATSEEFDLDTIPPDMGDPPIEIHDINENSSVGTITAEVALNVSDDTDMDQKVGYDKDLKDASWEDYSTSTTVATTTETETRPDIIYATVRDYYNNSIPIVATPTEHIVRGRARNDSNGNYIYTNCLDTSGGCSPTSTFGVILDVLDMQFSGYASTSAGWLSFQATGTPPNYDFNSNCISGDDIETCDDSATPACTACYNPFDGNVYGWARRISDGTWLKLRGSVGADFSDISMDRSDQEFQGSAFNVSSGDELIFNCEDDSSIDCSTDVDYRVRLINQNDPSADTLEAPHYTTSTGETNSLCSSDPFVSVRTVYPHWTFGDSDGGAYQSKYEVEISTTSDRSDSFAQESATSSGYGSSIIDGVGDQVTFNASDGIDYDTSYYWWVQVYDNFGFPSGWTQFNTTTPDHELTHNEDENSSQYTFTTYKHEFPRPYIYWFPHDEPSQKQTILFSAIGTSSSAYQKSKIYKDEDGRRGSNPVTASTTANYQDITWSAGSQNPDNIEFTSSTSTPTTTAEFYEGTSSVELEITDNDGYTCSTSTGYNVEVMPDWEEVKTPE